MSEIGPAVLDDNVFALGLAAALGLFLGLEREWSDKSAGIRTFALVTLSAAVFTILGEPLLLVAGALLIAAIGLVLIFRRTSIGAVLSGRPESLPTLKLLSFNVQNVVLVNP
jgi:hypothetical protein